MRSSHLLVLPLSRQRRGEPGPREDIRSDAQPPHETVHRTGLLPLARAGERGDDRVEGDYREGRGVWMGIRSGRCVARSFPLLTRRRGVVRIRVTREGSPRAVAVSQAGGK